MRDIKLIALDVDGTLLDRQKHISPRTNMEKPVSKPGSYTQKHGACAKH